MPVVKKNAQGVSVPVESFEVAEVDQPSLGYMDIIGASFRTENTVGSYFNEEEGLPTSSSAFDFDVLNPNAPRIDYVDRAIDDFKDLEFNADNFYRFGQVRTEQEYSAMKRQVEKEQKDRALIGRADFGTQFMANATAGVFDFDVAAFIPGIGQIKKAATLAQTAKQAAKFAAAGAATSGVTELALRETQVTRTDEDMEAALIGGAVFGGVLGGAVSAARKMDIGDIELRLGKEIKDEVDGKQTFGVSSASAAEVKKTTLDQEGIAGGSITKAVGKLVSKDRFATDNKVLQGLYSPFKKARELTQELAESTGLKIKKAEDGIAVARGGTIESLNKLARGSFIKADRNAKDLWVQMRKGRDRKVGDMFAMDIGDTFGNKGAMNYREFQREVGKAMRRNDEHEIPEVQQAAQTYRKEVFDPLVKDAVELDLLPEGVSVDTAASYFTRVYDIQGINRNPNEFAQVTQAWLRDQQAKNSDIQDAIEPLIEERELLKSATKKQSKQIERGEQRGDILKAQTEEGFRYLRDIRNRIGVGKKQIDNMRGRFEDLGARIFEKEGLSDKLMNKFNDDLGAKIVDLNGKLLDLFESKKSSLENKKSFNRMVRKVKGLKDFKPKYKNPVMQFLKGRIAPDGRFADELAAMDITPKTFPGYFKKGGMTDADNIPLDEFPELVDHLDIGSGTNPDGYFSANDFITAISEEMGGKPLVMYDDLGRFEKHQELVDFKAELEGLGLDLDAPDLFEQYGQLKSQEDSFDAPYQEMGEGQDVFDEIDFYDRASEILPDVKKTLDEAIQRINKMPDAKKVNVDKDLRELKGFIEDIEIDLKLDRQNFKGKSKTLAAKEQDFGRIEKERSIIDRDATRKAKGRTKSLLKKIDDVNKLRTDEQGAQFRIQKLEDEITELAAKWNSKTGSEFKKHLENSEVPKAEKLDQIIKTIKGTDTRLEDAELLSIAEEIRQRIVSTPDGRLPYASKLNEDGSGGGSVSFDNGDKPSMFKGRAFAIPDELIEKFLISDADTVASSYIHKAAPFMNMHKRFNGDVDLVNTFKDIETEYNDLVRNASPDEAERLGKEYQNTIKNMAALRNRALGVDVMSSDPASVGSRVLRSIRTFNVTTMLGGMTLSAIPDVGRLVSMGSPVLRDAIMPMIKGIGDGSTLRKMREFNDLGVSVELVSNNRMMQLGDIGDDVQSRTAIERGIDYAGDKFGIASLMAPWNEMLKQTVTLTTEATILRQARKLLEGKASKEEITSLANNGFDAEIAERVIAQFDKYGENHKGLNLLNAQDWDDRLAKDAFLSALVKESDRIIVTPGYDKSVNLNSSEMAKTMAQFKSFFMAATTKIMLRGLQDGADPRNVGMFLSMITMGSMVYALKTAQAGKELSDNPAIWIAEGFDRAGVGGLFMEVNNMFEKGMGIGLRPMVGGEISSRYASRSVADNAIGPTFGRLVNLSYIAKAIGTGEWSEGDKNAAVSFIPGQNLPYIQPLTNELKEALK